MTTKSKIFIFFLINLSLSDVFVFSQSNSIDSLINIYKYDDKNEINIIKIGEAYAAEKMWNSAIYYYKKLVEIDPNNSDYLYRLGGTQAAYSEEVSKFKVLSIIKTAKQNLIKSANLDDKHIYSRWALVQIYSELPEIIGGSKKLALIYCEEILKISKIHGWFSYYYFYNFHDNKRKSEEYKNKIVGYLKLYPNSFEFNHFNFLSGKLLADVIDGDLNLSVKYLNTYISNYSSADRVSKIDIMYYLNYSNQLLKHLNKQN